MKEAQGELNLTMVTVISVAILLSFFYTVIWPMLKDNQTSVSKCNAAICGGTKNNDGTVNCEYTDEDGDTTYFKCAWKG